MLKDVCIHLILTKIRQSARIKLDLFQAFQTELFTPSFEGLNGVMAFTANG